MNAPAEGAVSRRAFLGTGLLGVAASSALARWAHAQCIPTTSDALGPYYQAGSPSRTVIASADEAGTRLFLTGYVRAADCTTPLWGTIVEAWQANNNGCYSVNQQCADEDAWNLRGQAMTDFYGEFALETVLPGYYPGRCRHIHWRFAPVGGPVLVTQLYFQGDPRIPTDPLASAPSAAARIIPLTQQADGLHGTWTVALNATATDPGDEGPEPGFTYLHAGFPNPFREAALVRWSLAQPGHVELVVLDVGGRRVRTLVARDVAAGYHSAAWDGRDDAGRAVGAGIYLCRLTTAAGTQTRKLVRER